MTAIYQCTCIWVPGLPIPLTYIILYIDPLVDGGVGVGGGGQAYVSKSGQYNKLQPVPSRVCDNNFH